MPNPDRLLRIFEQAVRAFRDTPGRRGRLVELQEVSEVLVAGDMHGNLDGFRRLLDVAALAKNPTRHLIVQELVHGPHRYPSGGDKSHQMIDVLAALKCQFPKRVHMLMGNHELAEWTGQQIGKGDELLNGIFRQGVDEFYSPRGEEVYAAYGQFFAVLPLAIRTPNRVFLSHSLPKPVRLANFDIAALEHDETAEEDLKLGGAVHSLVWGRDTRPEHVAAFLKKVDADLLITGHIPCENGFEAPNDQQLILDTLKDPACYCLFPTDRPLTHAELLECVGAL